MRRILLLVAVYVSVANPEPLRAAVVDTQINPANGHTYHLLAATTWTDGEAEAVSLGAHLVTVNDADEDQWIWDTFGADGARLLWIGLNDIAVEGNYVWTNGEPLTYTNWALGQPSGDLGTVEDWVQMGYYHPPISIRNWNDLVNVADWQGFPVQGVVEIVPEPSTVALALISAISWGVIALCRRRNTFGRVKQRI